jgi:hypothetical protein
MAVMFKVNNNAIEEKSNCYIFNFYLSNINHDEWDILEGLLPKNSTTVRFQGFSNDRLFDQRLKLVPIASGARP